MLWGTGCIWLTDRGYNRNPNCILAAAPAVIMTDKIIVLTTWPDLEGAKNLSGKLVESSLAACVNVLPPMISIYQWQGELVQGDEHLLIIKTRAALYDRVETAILEQHPYELPEIIAVPVSTGLPGYLGWINEATHAENE